MSGISTELLTSIDGLDTDGITARKILLAGEPVFVSLGSDVPPGFVNLQAREASSGLLSQFRKDSPKVTVAVDQRIFDIKRLRCALVFDGYLGWGQKAHHKGHTILFGGGETDAAVNVEIMVFHENKLIELHEKSLPSTRVSYFRDALQTMVADLVNTYPTARFVQAAPLTDWKLENVEYIGDAPLRKLSYRPLSKTQAKRLNVILPAALAIMGVMFYLGAVIKGWDSYSNAIADYDSAITDSSIKAKGGLDTDYLTTMNARRMYMEQPRRQTALAEKASSIVRGIASVPNVRIVEMKLPAPSINPQAQIGITVNPDAQKMRNHISQDRTPDVWLSIAVQRSGDAAIIQAKGLMTQIANSTGMSLRLAHQGWRDDQTRRHFNLEGFIHE